MNAHEPTLRTASVAVQVTVVSPSGKISFHHFAVPEKGLVDYDLVKLADGTNVITSYEYDNLGRITRKVMPKAPCSHLPDCGCGVPTSTVKCPEQRKFLA